ncbi:MAG: glycoside hydrolase family 3 protein [Bacteroidia bacterium]|nr:glycoside hydrolase family 3 protein [Bacteroidia bacterium]
MTRSRIFVCILMALACTKARAQQRDSLDIKIGQMILIGFPKAEVDPIVLEEIRQGKVGSIIIFEKNIPVKNSFAALKKITWTYQHAAPIPIFIAIDQEGGRVNRLKPKYGFTNSITAEAMGKAGTLDSVQFYAEATAATLGGLGINVNFAPVVDVNVNPQNPVIARHGRSFSANEDSVTLLAKEFIEQHHKYNVLTSLKHFPGHGSSKDDTHLGIADVTNTWQRRELTPYAKLIEEGYADAVMTSHIVNKKLDPDGHPGTLSDNILTGILRKELHFDGVIFSDDMQMHAITKHYGLEDAIRLAILAGVDIMTFSNNISGSDNRTVDVVHKIIKEYVKKGEISEERIDESYRRIMKVKHKLFDNTDYKAEAQRLQQQLVQQEKYAREAAQRAQALYEQTKAEYEAEKAKQEGGKKKKKKKD